MEVTFHLESFDGPLDLLLSLISKNKVSIFDIPIAEILDQYMEYLDKMKSFDMEIASSFVTMAAQLTYIKSKMLLPKNDEQIEEDPRASLVEALLEYQKIKLAGEALSDMGETGLDIFTRERESLEKEKRFSGDAEVSALVKAAAKMFERFERKAPPPINKFAGIVGRETVSVGSKIAEIASLLAENDSVSFMSLVEKSRSRSEIVAVFLALLELIKAKKIDISEKGEDYVLTLKQAEKEVTENGQ